LMSVEKVGIVNRRERLGGLLNYYHRQAGVNGKCITRESEWGLNALFASARTHRQAFTWRSSTVGGLRKTSSLRRRRIALGWFDRRSAIPTCPFLFLNVTGSRRPFHENHNSEPTKGFHNFQYASANREVLLSQT